MFIALTPLSVFWLHEVSGLSMDLVNFAYLPLIIYSVLPSLTVLINFQRAMLVFSKNTKPITYATITEVIGITIILIITIKFMNMAGLLAAVIAFVIGRLGANTYLFPPFFKSLKKVTY
jgi:hypothetical protein